MGLTKPPRIYIPRGPGDFFPSVCRRWRSYPPAAAAVTALDDIPALAVTRADAARLHRGQAVLLRGRDAPNSSGTVYVTVAGRLLALAEIGNGELIPKRVFNLAGLVGSRRLQKGH